MEHHDTGQEISTIEQGSPTDPIAGTVYSTRQEYGFWR